MTTSMPKLFLVMLILLGLAELALLARIWWCARKNYRR
jgi:hypothetical protein